jgi:hypothetical protein
LQRCPICKPEKAKEAIKFTIHSSIHLESPESAFFRPPERTTRTLYSRIPLLHFRLMKDDVEYLFIER